MRDFFHLRRKRKSGFTLIELVVAFAILGVTAGAVGGFVIAGVKSYRKNNQAAAVQQEVQVGMNRIDALLKEASLGISYNVESQAEENGSLSHFAASDAAAGVKSVKYKAVYSFTWDSEKNQILCKIVRWNPATEKVEYLETAVPESNNRVAEILNLSTLKGWEVLANNIDTFNFDLSQVPDSGLVNYSVRAKQDLNEYESSNSVNLRNDAVLNPETVEVLYDQVEAVVKTTINGVTLSSSSGTIVKGGSAQLTTRVNGTGYPSQLIHQWQVHEVCTASGTGMEGVEDSKGLIQPADKDNAVYKLIYDSSTAGENYSASINTSTKLLTLNASSTATLLRVTAIVKSGSKTYKAYVYLSVKEISAFSIRPKRDQNGALTFLQLASNKKLKDYTQDYPTASKDTDLPKIHIFAGNEVPLEAILEGTNLNENDKRVSWNIVEKSSENVQVTVSADGTLLVGQYTKSGTVLLKAYPYLDPTKERFYQIEVESIEDDPDNALTITGMQTMNRGGKLQLGLKLNGIEVEDLTEFNWSVSVNGPSGTVSGAPASVSKNGLLTISSSLGYGYAYSVTVTAQIKDLPDVVAMATLRVPKVELTMINPKLAGKRGTTISGSDLRCVVTGIEKCELEWTVASAANPDIYSTSLLNGTFLTVDPDTMSASLSISSREPSDLSYFRVKAAIKGNPSISALSYIYMKPVNFAISSNEPVDGVARGKSATLTSTFVSGGEGISTATTRWELVSAVDSNGKSVTLDGVSLTGEWGSSVKLLVEEDYYLTDKDVYVTVQASLSGLTATREVKIQKLKGVEITPETTTVTRGGSVKLSASWNNYLANWTVLSVSGGSTDISAVTLSSSATSAGTGRTLTGAKEVYVHVKKDAFVTESNVIITVQAEIQGFKGTADITVEGLKITLKSNGGATDTSGRQGMDRGSGAYIDVSGYTGDVSWSCSNSNVSLYLKNNNQLQCWMSVPYRYSLTSTSAVNYTVTATIKGDNGNITKSVNFKINPVSATRTPTDGKVNRGSNAKAQIGGFSASMTMINWSIQSVKSADGNKDFTKDGLTLVPSTSSNHNSAILKVASNYYLTTEPIKVTVVGTVVEAENTSSVITTKTFEFTINGVSSGLNISGNANMSTGELNTLTASYSGTGANLSEVKWSLASGTPAGVQLSASTGASTILSFTSAYKQTGDSRNIIVNASLAGLNASFVVTVKANFTVSLSPVSSEVLRGGTVSYKVNTEYQGENLTLVANGYYSGGKIALSGTLTTAGDGSRTYTVTLPANFDTGNGTGDYIKLDATVPGGSASNSSVKVKQVTMTVTDVDAVNKFVVSVSGYASSVTNLSIGISKDSNRSSIPGSTDKPCNMALTASATTRFEYSLAPATESGVSDCGPVYAYAGIGGLMVKSSGIKVIGFPTSGTLTVKTYDNSDGKNTGYYKPFLAYYVYLQYTTMDNSNVIYFATKGERMTNAGRWSISEANDKNRVLAKDGSTWYYLTLNTSGSTVYAQPQKLTGSESAYTYYPSFDTNNGRNLTMNNIFNALNSFYAGNSSSYKMR